MVKKHRDPLSRLVHEAVKINDQGCLNSKSEWQGFTIARLTVEKTEIEAKKSVVESEALDENTKGEMFKLKCRVVAHAKNSASSALNQTLDCRKRKMQGVNGARPKADAVAKRVRMSEANMTPVGRSSALRTSTPVAPDAAQPEPELPNLSSSSSVEASLSQAVDLAESTHMLGGSGDSAILAVPIYRQAISFSTSSSLSDPDSASSNLENMLSISPSGDLSQDNVDLLSKNLSNLDFRASRRGHSPQAATDCQGLANSEPTTKGDLAVAALLCAHAGAQKTTIDSQHAVVALSEALDNDMSAPTDGADDCKKAEKAIAPGAAAGHQKCEFAPPGVSVSAPDALTDHQRPQNPQLSLVNNPTTLTNAPTSLDAQNPRSQRSQSCSRRASSKLKARKEAKEGNSLKRKKTRLSSSSATKISAGKQQLLTRFFSESLNLPGAADVSKFGLEDAVFSDKCTAVQSGHGSRD